MMFGLAGKGTIALWICMVVVILQISDSRGQMMTEEEIASEKKKENQEKKKEENAISQDLGTGVHEEKDEMDFCELARGPRPINEVFSPGRTIYATVDDVNGGFCGVSIDSPGIWWWVEGTGKPITVSSCHLQTEIKVKFSAFTGSCDALECVTGSDAPDFECPILKEGDDSVEWNTMASAMTFESEKDKDYYILVQQMEYNGTGTIWLNFREPNVPQNNNCPDAIGPVPRDFTMIENSSVDATVSKVFDYCGGEEIPALYPGTWFQNTHFPNLNIVPRCMIDTTKKVMGTGEPVTVMACSKDLTDGFAFSVYNGAYCDGMDCVEGEYELFVDVPELCTFGSAQVSRPMTKYTFDTIDRDRYWIYVHSARTRAEKPTADFRFYVDDGKDGKGGTSGAHMIQYYE